MKRHFIYALSVLALTVGSDQLYAADVKPTPRAPRERAAPARAAPERPAPVREAARPAPAQQTSWTGSQAGGFGGGNSGGGSFADPIALCGGGFGTGISSFPGFVCPATGISFDGDNKISATGGAFLGYNVQVLPFLVVGIEADIAAARVKSESTQTNTHPTAPADPSGYFTTETYHGSFTQGTNGSVRGRIGVPFTFGSQSVMVYATGGLAVGKVEAHLNYAGSNYAPGCAPFVATSSCFPVNAGGAASYSETRTGYTVGGGGEWAFLPGVKLRIEYRYTSFGDFSFAVPVFVTSPCPVGGTCAAQDVVNVKADHQRLVFGVGFGL